MEALKGRERTISILVFGCGVALGLTGLYGYYRSRKMFLREMRSLSLVVECLKQEVEELKAASRSQSPGTLPVTSPRKTNLHLQDDVDGASGDEEFFEFADNESSDNNQNPDPNSVEFCLAMAKEWFTDASLDAKVLYDRVEELCNRFDRPAEFVCLLTKASNLLVSKAAKAGNLSEKKRLAVQTSDLGREALQKNPNCAECHKWFAIGLGGLSDFVATREKIENGSKFKEHVDIAVRLAPTDATLHHLLGRFCYSIANLSWIERKVASTLFAEVPAATLSDARQHFQRAYQFKRDWKENILYLAKCCLELKEVDEGRRLIDEGLKLLIKGEDDELSNKDLLLLKQKYMV